MTDEEARELAKSCLMAVLNNNLEAVAFTDTLRRGLQKWLDKLDVHRMSPEQLDWQTLTLIEGRRFPGLEAFLFRVDYEDGTRDVLVGVDESLWVSEFASVGTPHSLRESYLHPSDPWFHVAGFSTMFQLNGLLPFEGVASGSGGNRNDKDQVHFYVKVAPESWDALSFDQREPILDGLERIALNDYWLRSKRWGSKQRVHVTVIESQDRGGDTFGYVGSPPPELVLAERFVDIPTPYN